MPKDATPLRGCRNANRTARDADFDAGLRRKAQTVQELLRTRGSDQLQDADSSRIKVYVRKAGHLPDTMVGE